MYILIALHGAAHYAVRQIMSYAKWARRIIGEPIYPRTECVRVLLKHAVLNKIKDGDLSFHLKFFQLSSKYLTGRGEREFFNKAYFARDFVVSKALLAIAHQFFGIGSLSFFQYDKSLYKFPRYVILFAYGNSGVYRGMFTQDSFDFLRVHVKSAHYDDVCGTVYNLKESVLIYANYVACIEPITVKAFLGIFWDAPLSHRTPSSWIPICFPSLSVMRYS